MLTIGFIASNSAQSVGPEDVRITTCLGSFIASNSAQSVGLANVCVDIPLKWFHRL